MFLLCLLFFVGPIKASGPEPACQSLNTVISPDFTNYDGTLPDLSSGVPFRVSTRIRIEQITKIDDNENSVSLMLTLIAWWNDTRLLDPNDKCNYKLEESAVKKIWQPTFYLLNAKSMESKPSAMYDTSNFVYVAFGGFVRIWDLDLTIYCDFDFSYYPLDDHVCKFRLAHVELDINVVVVDFDKSYEEDFSIAKTLQRELQYKLEYAKMSDSDKQIEFHGMTYSVNGFNILLERKLTPYILNVYLPSTVLVIVSWISFQIPTDTIPGRMALLVTCYLVLANIGNGARSKAPANGDATLADVWLQFCMVFVALALFEYAFLLVIIRRSKYKRVESEMYENGQNDVTLKTSPVYKIVKLTDDVSTIAFPVVFVFFALIYIGSTV